MIIHWTFIVFRPHCSTTYVNVAYCYRLNSVVCRSVCYGRERCGDGCTDRDAVWIVDSGGPKARNYVLDGVPDPHGKGQFWGGKGRHIVKYSDYTENVKYTIWEDARYSLHVVRHISPVIKLTSTLLVVHIRLLLLDSYAILCRHSNWVVYLSVAFTQNSLWPASSLAPDPGEAIPPMCGGDAAFSSNYFDHLYCITRQTNVQVLK